jgi:hypothetical protein
MYAMPEGVAPNVTILTDARYDFGDSLTTFGASSELTYELDAAPRRTEMAGLRPAVGTFLVLLGSLMLANEAMAASGGPLDAFTGAPEIGGGTEAVCTDCHSSFPLNSGPGSLSISAPETYEPGVTYEIDVLLTQTGRIRWGFEITTVDEALIGAGALLPSLDGETQVSLSGTREYLKQTSSGSADGQLDQKQWTFNWTAPPTDLGSITFYAAGVAADSTGGSSGDDVYTTSISVPEPSALALQIVGVLAVVVIAEAHRRRPS